MFTIGQKIKVKVKNIQNYGVFCYILDDESYRGLIHVSEISHDFVKNINDYVKIGDMMDVKVTKIDEEKKQLSLSAKALIPYTPKPKSHGEGTHSGFSNLKHNTEDSLDKE